MITQCPGFLVILVSRFPGSKPYGFCEIAVGFRILKKVEEQAPDIRRDRRTSGGTYSSSRRQEIIRGEWDL